MKTSRKSVWSVVIILLASILGRAGPLGAVDFIRGDINNDGEVTLADVYAIFHYLFIGSELNCL